MCECVYVEGHFWRLLVELLNSIWSVFRYCNNSKNVLSKDSILKGALEDSQNRRRKVEITNKYLE